MQSFFLDVPNWVANSFPTIKFILLCILLLCALSLIVVVMMQETEGGDTMNSITGIKDTYYGKNHGANREGRLKKATIIFAVLIAVFTIAFFVLNAIYAVNLWA